MLPLSGFSLPLKILEIVFFTLPFWLPLVLIYAAWRLWRDYVNLVYLSKLKWVLLEIRLPKDIRKTPLSMELVLSALHQTSSGTWLEKLWDGKMRPWFSLELVSLGGDVHFFIRTEEKYKNFLESRLYSQYAGIEIYEVDDYTHEVAYARQKGEWDLWGTEFRLIKPDPYPIKTYVDYQLDRAPQREEEASGRTDPITPVIEYFGTIGKNERIWLQILIQATGKRFAKRGSWFGKTDWKDEAKYLVQKLQKTKEEGGTSPGERGVVEAIERSVSKLGFDSGVRIVYLAKKDSFQGITIPGIVSILKQYNSETLNGFTLQNETDFDYPWQDYKGIRLAQKKRDLLRAYCERAYFYLPFKKKPFVLNTEELATIYHFPNEATESPGFVRISSRKGEPPTNLPV